MRNALTILLIACLTLASPAKEKKDSPPLLPDGAYGTTIQGGVTDKETRSYTLTGKKGQQFRASLVSLDDNGYLTITDGQGQSLLEGMPKTAKVRNLDIVLPRTGKYKLTVASSKGQCSYLLEVTLDDPPEDSPPEPNRKP